MLLLQVQKRASEREGDLLGLSMCVQTKASMAAIFFSFAKNASCFNLASVSDSLSDTFSSLLPNAKKTTERKFEQRV